MHLFRSHHYQVFPDRSSVETPTIRGISWTPLPEALNSKDTMKQTTTPGKQLLLEENPKNKQATI